MQKERKQSKKEVVVSTRLLEPQQLGRWKPFIGDEYEQ